MDFLVWFSLSWAVLLFSLCLLHNTIYIRYSFERRSATNFMLGCGFNMNHRKQKGHSRSSSASSCSNHPFPHLNL